MITKKRDDKMCHNKECPKISKIKYTQFTDNTIHSAIQKYSLLNSDQQLPMHDGTSTI